MEFRRSTRKFKRSSVRTVLDTRKSERGHLKPRLWASVTAAGRLGRRPGTEKED
jgi:hypothetical protein